MAAPRSYTPAQRSDALVRLAANGGVLKRTSRETSIPEATLRQWSKGIHSPQAKADCALKLRPTADDCERIAAKILVQIETKINSGTLQGSATVFGIMVDKAQLLRSAADANDFAEDQDLSILSAEQLETIDGWIRRARDRKGSRPDMAVGVHELDVAAIPMELASQSDESVSGCVGDGADTQADGIYAPEAREERVS